MTDYREISFIRAKKRIRTLLIGFWGIVSALFLSFTILVIEGQFDTAQICLNTALLLSIVGISLPIINRHRGR